jgi:hypothetical protein
LTATVQFSQLLAFTIYSCIINPFFTVPLQRMDEIQMYSLTKSTLTANRQLLVFSVAGFAVLCGLLFHYHPVDSVSTGVLAWWCALCVVSVLNICGWRLSATALARSLRFPTAAAVAFRGICARLCLSFVFAAGGCATDWPV